jgi:hypothetical protein
VPHSKLILKKCCFFIERGHSGQIEGKKPKEFILPKHSEQSKHSEVKGIKNIIPDILSLKTTRAFWRQKTFNFNKPAPFGAKLHGAFHWKCSTPFYS